VGDEGSEAVEGGGGFGALADDVFCAGTTDAEHKKRQRIDLQISLSMGWLCNQ
jgi:hypothetical protein